MTNQKSKHKYKYVLLLSIILLFISCSQAKQNYYIILTDWENVEKSYFEKNVDYFYETLEIFNSNFLAFQKTMEYMTSKYLDTDLKIYEANTFFTTIIEQISINIETLFKVDFYSTDTDKAVFEIRKSLIELQKVNYKNSIVSIQHYFFILTTLILIIILISAFLYIVLNKYEKEATDLKELDVYSQIMIDGIEKERKRISKELHDTIIQNLKVIQLENETIEINDDKGLLLNRKNKIKAITDESIKQLRKLCHNLNPPEIKSSLLASLTAIFNQFREDSNIQLNIKAEDDLITGTFTTQQILHIFRIVQESLINIKNHADAKTVSILIRNKNKLENGITIKYLLIFIMDDGIGFDENKINKSERHFGIENMRERAKLLGGKLDIISEIGEGTEITLEVPLNE